MREKVSLLLCLLLLTHVLFFFVFVIFVLFFVIYLYDGTLSTHIWRHVGATGAAIMRTVGSSLGSVGRGATGRESGHALRDAIGQYELFA